MTCGSATTTALGCLIPFSHAWFSICSSSRRWFSVLVLSVLTVAPLSTADTDSRPETSHHAGVMYSSIQTLLSFSIPRLQGLLYPCTGKSRLSEPAEPRRPKDKLAGQTFQHRPADKFTTCHDYAPKAVASPPITRVETGTAFDLAKTVRHGTVVVSAVDGNHSRGAEVDEDYAVVASHCRGAEIDEDYAVAESHCRDAGIDGDYRRHGSGGATAVSPEPQAKDLGARKTDGRVLAPKGGTAASLVPLRRARGRGGHDDKEDEDDHDENGGRGRGTPSHANQGPRRVFACPFYKFDSIRHMPCSRLHLLRIRDVKQHLNRRHYHTGHCAVCGFELEDAQRRDNHLRNNSTCRPPPGRAAVDGVTESQRMALARRSNRGLDEQNQWFSIWRILFPGTACPPSPYLPVSTRLGDVLNVFNDYWEVHRDTLVAEAVQSTSGGTEPSADRSTDAGIDDNNNRRVTEISSRVVDILLSRFRERSQTTTGSGISVTTPPDLSVAAGGLSPPPEIPFTTSPPLIAWDAPDLLELSEPPLDIPPWDIPFPSDLPPTFHLQNLSSTASESSAPFAPLFFPSEPSAPGTIVAGALEAPDMMSASLAYMGDWADHSYYSARDNVRAAQHIIPGFNQVYTPLISPYTPLGADMYDEFSPDQGEMPNH